MEKAKVYFCVCGLTFLLKCLAKKKVVATSRGGKVVAGPPPVPFWQVKIVRLFWCLEMLDFL